MNRGLQSCGCWPTSKAFIYLCLFFSWEMMVMKGRPRLLSWNNEEGIGRLPTERCKNVTLGKCHRVLQEHFMNTGWRAQKAISNKVHCFIFAWGYAQRTLWHRLIEGAVIYATEERLADRTEMSARRRALDSFEVIRVSLGQCRLDKRSPYLPEAQSRKAKGHLVQSLSWTVGNKHLRDVKTIPCSL